MGDALDDAGDFEAYEPEPNMDDGVSGCVVCVSVDLNAWDDAGACTDPSR